MNKPVQAKSYYTILLLNILMGCQTNEDSTPELLDVESKYDNLENEVIEQNINISIYISEERYSLPTTQLKMLLDNQGQTAIQYDNPIYLDKLQDGVWSQIPIMTILIFQWRDLN